MLSGDGLKKRSDVEFVFFAYEFKLMEAGKAAVFSYRVGKDGHGVAFHHKTECQ